MDLLLIADQNKSHYVYIKYFDRFMCNKTKNKNEKHFFRVCVQYFNREKYLIEHKKVFLKINGKQSGELRSGWIKFKNFFNQFALPFKIYTEPVLKRTHMMIELIMLLTPKSIKHIFLVVFLTKLYVMM